MKMTKSFLTVLLIAGGVAFGALRATGGGPISNCESGRPLVWPAGGVNIPFNPDQGTLGPLTHAEAVAAVQAALNVWQDVPTATASYLQGAELPVDVDVSNFADYVWPWAPDGLSAIVFDADGQIFDLLFGPGSGILGFASPEWMDPATCTVLEGVCFLNGPAFADFTAALDVMVHEFGHYTGLGHSVVNGQIFLGDTSGPTPNDQFSAPALTDVETMYPFYFGPGFDWNVLHNDDVSAVSTLYPTPEFSGNSGAIQGTIFAANGTTKLTGVNVIARNVANPFQDAVSAISGDFSVFWLPTDPLTGTYTLRGLTPGAQYAVYIDQILAGGFSTPPVYPFPGVEEFFNGANESNGLGQNPDNPADYIPVTPAAGTITSAINVVFNGFRPGDSLPVGDDGFVELPLPFPFRIGGRTFQSVFVNANGSLTFGQPDWWFEERISGFLAGAPRIAGLWDDLNPSQGGKVSYQQTRSTFAVTWSKVPEWFNSGEVTFQITLLRDANGVEIRYEKLTVTDGLAGISCGGTVTSGSETPTDLTAFGTRWISSQNQPALFELFEASHPNDLAGRTVRFTCTAEFNDEWAGPNNTIEFARRITLPFDTKDVSQYTEIEPAGADVDYFRFSANAGDYLVARVVGGRRESGALLDSMLGLFRIDSSGGRATGTLLAYDDDSGPGVWSLLVYPVTETGDYALAATTWPDYDFNGTISSGGGRYVLDVHVLRPDPTELVINGGFEFGTFLGWTTDMTGFPFIPWLVSAAGDGAGYEMAPTAPPEGTFGAWNGFDGEGPMQFTMYQDVQIPGAAPSAIFRWSDRVQWNFFGGQTLARVYQVQLRDPDTTAVLATLHTVDTGIADGLGDTGWQTHTVDLSAFIGSRVRLWFEQQVPEPFTGPAQLEIDAVSLTTQ